MIKTTTITVPFDSACKMAELMRTGQEFKIADVPAGATIESFGQLPSGDFELIYSVDDGEEITTIDIGTEKQCPSCHAKHCEHGPRCAICEAAYQDEQRSMRNDPT